MCPVVEKRYYVKEIEEYLLKCNGILELCLFAVLVRFIKLVTSDGRSRELGKGQR